MIIAIIKKYVNNKSRNNFRNKKTIILFLEKRMRRKKEKIQAIKIVLQFHTQA